MPSLARSILTHHWFHRFLYHFLRLYSLTLRLRITNETRWQELVETGTPVLLCTWHQQFFGAIRHFKRYANYQPALMISQSKDGAIVAAVAKLTGWRAIRGSSSNGGRPALRAMIRHLQHTRLAAHVLDGPTGPMGIVKAGAIRLAHEARAVIVPFSVSAQKAIYFNSWDRFMLPLPFSRVTLQFEDPVHLPPTKDRHHFERQRAHLEAIMSPLLAGR